MAARVACHQQQLCQATGSDLDADNGRESGLEANNGVEREGER